MRLLFLLFLTASVAGVAGCDTRTETLSQGESTAKQEQSDASESDGSSLITGSGAPIKSRAEVAAPDSDSGNVASEPREECDFDQNEQIKNNALLKEKYRGSRLDEGYVVIPVEEGEVWVGIGGCAHFGITVALRTQRTEGALTEAQFMAQILYLAKTYSQDYVDAHRLEEIIKSKRWESDRSAAISKFYLIHYDGDDPDDLSRFEAYEEEHEADRTVGFTYSFL